MLATELTSLLGQLVERCTGTQRSWVQVWMFFFRPSFHYCSSSVHYCEDLFHEFHIFTVVYSSLYGLIWNQHNDQLSVGLLALSYLRLFPQFKYMTFIYSQSFIRHFTGLFGTNIMTSSHLAERCTGIQEVTGSNPVQAWIFFRPYFHYCPSIVHYCEDLFHEFHIFTVVYSSLYGLIWNQHNDQLSVGLLTQLVERCRGIAVVMDSNPVQAWMFFSGLIFPSAQLVFITAKVSFIFKYKFYRLLISYDCSIPSHETVT